MQLFVGLGNPGPQYAGHRHNAGFMALDALAEEYRAAPWSKKFGGLVTEIEVNLSQRERSQSQGGLSAEALAKAEAAGDAGEGQNPSTINHQPSTQHPHPARFTRRPLPVGEVRTEKLLLLKPLTFMNLSGQAVGEAMRFYKLAPERVTVFHDELDLPLGKLRIKTGGGHGGHNGLKDIDTHIGPDYRRVRLGIGHPGDRDAVTGYVLHDFGKEERAALDALLAALARELPLLASGEDNAVMTRLAAL